MKGNKKMAAMCKNCGHELFADSELQAYWKNEIKHFHALSQSKGRHTIACLSEDCLCSEPRLE